MTSTVLDVTLMLLCVSASVVVLGAAGNEVGHGTEGHAAADVADRLVTETATVTYEVDGDHDSRTVHATLVELLVMTVGGGPDDGAETAGRFRAQALEAVEHALGGRTRVDVRYDADGEAAGAGPWMGAERDAWTVAVGPEPPAGADVTAAVVTHPGPTGADEPDPPEVERFRIVVRAW